MMDLDGVRRRLRAVADEASALGALTDADLLWLLANGWEPPAAVPPRRTAATSGTFVLTTEQYDTYRRTVREAQEIKELLQLAEAHRPLSSTGRSDIEVELRHALRVKAEQLQNMAAGWQLG